MTGFILDMAFKILTILLLSLTFAFGEADVDAWFDLHTDAEWSDLAGQWQAKRAAMDAPVENLTLPVESWDNGAVKTRLKAKRAQLLDLRYVFALGVTIEMFSADGKRTGYLEADDCLFDRKGRRGYCKGTVKGSRDGDEISSEGMYFSAANRYVRLLSRGEIRTGRFKGSFGRLKR